MIIFFNAPGVFTAIAGIAVGFVLGFLLQSPGLAIMIAAVIWLGADLVIRLKDNLPLRRRHPLWLVWPTTGGHLWFLPVWCLGIVLMFVGGMVFAVKPFITPEDEIAEQKRNHDRGRHRPRPQREVPLAGTWGNAQFQMQAHEQLGRQTYQLTNGAGQVLSKVQLQFGLDGLAGGGYGGPVDQLRWEPGQVRDIVLTHKHFYWGRATLRGEVWNDRGERFRVACEWTRDAHPKAGDPVRLGNEHWSIEFPPLEFCRKKTQVRFLNGTHHKVERTGPEFIVWLYQEGQSEPLKQQSKMRWIFPDSAMIINLPPNPRTITKIRFEGKGHYEIGTPCEIHCEWTADDWKFPKVKVVASDLVPDLGTGAVRLNILQSPRETDCLLEFHNKEPKDLKGLNVLVRHRLDNRKGHHTTAYTLSDVPAGGNSELQLFTRPGRTLEAISLQQVTIVRGKRAVRLLAGWKF